jgi:hypothetical protein
MAVALSVALWPLTCSAAPEARPWPRWEVCDNGSTKTIDHGTWDRFLGKFAHLGADGIVRVAYGKVGPADKAEIAGDLARLAATPISRFNRTEQLAYWIDLYNEVTVKFVLDHYPIPSINDRSAILKMFSSTPWSRKLINVEGEDLTLDDIEHRILRPGWRDSRVHYALNCASIGCPNLQTVAYTSANVNQLLETAAHEYINSPRGAKIVNGKLHVSSIFVWYKKDFGGTDTAVIAQLRRYAGPELLRALAGIEKVSSDSYDWSLNEEPAR